MDEAEEVHDIVLPAGDQPAEIVEPCEQPLHLPAPPVAAQRPAVLGLDLAVGAIRGDQLDPNFGKLLRERVAVVGLVPDEAPGDVADEARFEGRADQADFSRRSTGHVDGDRKTMAVRNCHEL